jgi:hypothetical protein
MFKPLLLAAAVAMSFTAADAARAQASAPASAAKKELVSKVLTLLRPAVENLAQQLAQQPAAQLQQGAGQALQRVPAERREAVARDIEADLRKYVEETVPLVREKAVKLAPSTIGVVLEERFTEDELRQIAALLESPVNRKFQQAFPEMQKVLGEKLVAESRAEIEPKVRALDQTVARRLGITPASGAASAAKPAAAPAKKP